MAAAKQGMVIFTEGVGTTGGELIPIADGAGGTQFVKDPAGNFVKSHLDADMLTRIAAVTGGVYTPLGPQGQGVVRLYEEKLKGLTQRQHADRQVAVYAELFQWPLGVAIALLILHWLLGVGVRRRTAVAVPANAVWVAALLLALATAGMGRAWASPLTAQEAYEHAQFSKAQRDYAQSLKKDPNRTRLQFNLGAAAYKAGDFTTAAAAFNNALRTREIPLQQSAYYNLGNALFRQGEKGVSSDPQATIKTWQQSIGAYDTALQIRPTDADAKFNRGVVQRRLDELQRQQQKQKQKQNDKNDKKDKNDQNGKNKPQDSKGQPGQQNQNGQPGQPNPQPAPGQPNPQPPQNQPGQQPAPTQSDPGSQPGQPPPQPKNGAASAQDIGKPDQMSRLEAEQLLDSTKGEERHLGIGVRNGKPENPAATPLRDW